MAKTPSSMAPLGMQAPHFSLPTAQGNMVSLESFKGQPLLVVFLCNHCPYVIHIQHVLRDLIASYQTQGLAAVGINSNNALAYPDDAPPRMIEESARVGYTFPYLVDASQDVARAYHAACTPDFFLFNTEHALVYRGQFDGSRPGNNVPVTGQDLRNAVEAVLHHTHIPSTQKPSLGCNIKWKA
jgi:peroxiredoxin